MMSPDGPGVVLLAGAVTVVAAVGLALGWDAGRGARRLAIRTTALVLCVVGTVATAGAQLNHLTETYPSWASLRPDGEASAAGDAAPDGGPDTAVGVGTGSAVTSVRVAGRASGLTLPMYVYLPAAYREPAGQQLRFPVIEALHGYPGSPRSWLTRLDVQHRLDAEIDAGRMAPTVVLFPFETTTALLDTECTDLVPGPRTETFLTRDVPEVAAQMFRLRSERAAWGLIGYSAGGFCAINLGLRHPQRYAAAASLSGYAAPGITIGDGSEKTTNNPLWRLRHLPPPPIQLYLAFTLDDAHARRDAGQLDHLARTPLSATTAIVAHGGHSHAAWRTMEAPAFDWLSARLARPDIA